MEESKIKAVAEAKVKDYLQDMIIKSFLENTNDPVGAAKKMRDDAVENCNFDDPSSEDSDKLQEAIQNEAQKFFDVLVAKLEQKTEDF